MNKILVSLCLAASVLQIVAAQPKLSADAIGNLKARVENGINVGIVVGIIDGSGIQYYSFGVKSLKTKEPVDEFSVFEIGSISKTFTGILFADMIIKGEVKPDDPIQKYLPNGVTAPEKNGESIRMIHLANHTSSLPPMPNNFTPANPANPYADYSEKQLYQFLNSFTITREIGTQYEYSNYAMGLLGHLLSSIKGLPYEQLMIDVIAGPLKMKDTRVRLTPVMMERLAMGHSAGNEVENWDIPTLAGAGAIRSTAADMMIYIGANMARHKGSLSSSLELSHRKSTADGIVPSVGLGWHRSPIDNMEIIWHNGGTGGYRAFAGFLSDGSKGVVVLSNSNTSVDDIGFHVLHPKSRLVDPTARMKEPMTEIALDEATMDTYVGEYALAPSFTIKVFRQGKQLMAQATGQPALPIYAREKNIFFLKAVNAQLLFTVGEDGTVNSLTLKQGGQEVVGKKMM